jgi:hypothetical protein
MDMVNKSAKSSEYRNSKQKGKRNGGRGKGATDHTRGLSITSHCGQQDPVAAMINVACVIVNLIRKVPKRKEKSYRDWPPHVDNDRTRQRNRGSGGKEHENGKAFVPCLRSYLQKQTVSRSVPSSEKCRRSSQPGSHRCSPKDD